MGRKKNTTDKLIKIKITEKPNNKALTTKEKYDLPFAKNLREYLVENNISQKALAENIDVKEQIISNICLGKTEPSIYQINLICKSLNVTADYLIGLSPNKSVDTNTQIASVTTGLSDLSVDKISNINNKSYNLPDLTARLLKQKTINFSNIANELIDKTTNQLVNDFVNFYIECIEYDFRCKMLFDGVEKFKRRKIDYDPQEDRYYKNVEIVYDKVSKTRWKLEKSISKLLDSYCMDIDTVNKKISE